MANDRQMETLRAQIGKLEREAAFLRTVDASMRERLARAVAEADEAKKMLAAQTALLNELRGQLDRAVLDLELARAELAMLPKPTVAAAAPELAKQEATRTQLLEVD